MTKKSSQFSNSEIRSGLFITLACIGLLTLLFAAGRAQLFQDVYKVNVLFGYISGLQKNAPVHFAGHKVGKVTNIELLKGSPEKIAVTISVSKAATLKKDSKAYIEIMGFMGEKFLEITPGSAEGAPLAENETLIGTDPIALTEIIRRGREIADELDSTTQSLKTLIENLDGTIEENRTDIHRIVGNMGEASDNMKAMTEDLKRHPWKLVFKGKENDPTKKKKHFFFF